MPSSFKLIRDKLIAIIESSSLTKFESNYLIESTRDLSDSSTFKLLFLLNEKSSSETQKMIKIALTSGIAGAIIVTPGGIPIALLTRKLYQMYNWKCGYNCKINKKIKDKKLCYKKCNVKSLEKVEDMLKSEISKCKNFKAQKYSEDKITNKIKSINLQNKCRNKLFNELIKIRQKRVEADLKLSQYLRSLNK